MSNENQDNKVYNLLISKGIDSYNEYEFYKERINSQNDFLWNEYNTQDDELNDDLFNKLFESAGKPVTQNQVNNQNPLYMSQQIKNNQNNLNNRYSPLNSPQRSEISEPAANANKLW